MRDRIGPGGGMQRPTRTWWMQRNDAVNYTILAIVLVFILWTALW